MHRTTPRRTRAHLHDRTSNRYTVMATVKVRDEAIRLCSRRLAGFHINELEHLRGYQGWRK